MDMTLENIAKLCGGRLVCGREDMANNAAGAQVDSRKIEKGNLFFAAKGERVDGHDFIENAFKAGASCAVCEREMPGASGPVIVVTDAYQALRNIAKAYRQSLDIPVVGITGSVGKTSTKEAIAAVLSAKFNVLYTKGNFNNNIGLPLTIMSIRKEHEAAVLEMGISHFGEMDELADIAKPDICVITNIGSCHLENLGDLQGVLRAKTEMFNHRGNGPVILNGDDALLAGINDVNGTKPVTFGCSEGCTFRIKNPQACSLLGSDLSLDHPGGEMSVFTPLPGKHMMINAACAAAVGHCMGLTVSEIREGLSRQKSVAGRSNVIKTDKYIVIDDCYNANPMSMKQAIELLQLTDTSSRRIAILGDMFELGEDERQLHRQVGEYAGGSGYARGRAVDVLITAGDLSEEIDSGCDNPGVEKHHFEIKADLMSALPEILQNGDTILIKASHGMHFEEIVDLLTGH